MKVLVTGGAGFIGSHLVDALVMEGHHVDVLDNLSTGKQSQVNSAAHLYQGNITDTAFVRNYFEGNKPEILFHLAAQPYVSLSTKEPEKDAYVNVVGSINLLKHGEEHGLRKVIYSNSGGASYGNPQYIPIDEEHPIHPVCPYGASKHAVEHYLEIYHMNKGLEFTSLRYANIYGPRQDAHGEGGVIAIFTQCMLDNQRATIFGDGSQVRDYCFIDDVVSANMWAMSNGSNDYYNVGTGIGTSTQQIHDLIKAEVGSTLAPIYAKEREGDLKACVLSPKKLESKGWKVTIALEEGIHKTVQSFQYQ